MKLLRIYRIMRVIKSYGLYRLLPKTSVMRWLYYYYGSLFWIREKHKNSGGGERLRLALQELGPVWVKLGQLMSTRRDLFPEAIADQLGLLQDRVAPFDGQEAKQIIEETLGGDIETWFDDFDITPLASGSIAQVHTAVLKENGCDVVLKIVRPGILPVIDADIKLMYFLAHQITRWVKNGERLHAVSIVRDYEKTLIGELNLEQEAANTLTLRNNFKESDILYIPRVYQAYTHNNLLVMERIYGVPISDIETLVACGTDMERLANRGVEIFFTQVFRDRFFHADMHPGNIFVNIDDPSDPKYIGIDCSIVGVLSKDDQRYLAESFIAFFCQDYRKIAELYIDSGWVAANTDVNEFEIAMRKIFEPIFAKPLAEIAFSNVLLGLLSTARKFEMEVQSQLVLLQKTLLYIEGLGRQIYPKLDLWISARPFLEAWVVTQRSPLSLMKEMKKSMPYWREILPELPTLVNQHTRQNKMLQAKMDTLTAQLDLQQKRNKSNAIGIVLVIILLCITLYTVR